MLISRCPPDWVPKKSSAAAATGCFMRSYTCVPVCCRQPEAARELRASELSCSLTRPCVSTPPTAQRVFSCVQQGVPSAACSQPQNCSTVAGLAPISKYWMTRNTQAKTDMGLSCPCNCQCAWPVSHHAGTAEGAARAPLDDKQQASKIQTWANDAPVNAHGLQGILQRVRGRHMVEHAQVEGAQRARRPR